MIDEMFGKKFGRLIILEKECKIDRYYRKFYYCKCDCGIEKWIRKDSLISKRTESCGCLNKEKVSKSNSSDISGRTFGRLFVISRCNYKDKSGNYMYLCRCDCGKEVIKSGRGLNSGQTQSCGCLWRERSKQKKYIDITNRKYYRLTVISYYGNDRNKQAIWLCKCDCGKKIIVRYRNLINGNTKSCGCYNRELSSIKSNQYNRKRRILAGYNPDIVVSNQISIDRQLFRTSDTYKNILKRDNYTCQFCPDVHENLEIHHILSWSEYPELRYEETNLITLCKICHIPIIHNGNQRIPVHEDTIKMLQKKVLK